MQPKANHLWNLYRKGDRPAFEKIYYQHVNLLYDYGVRMTRDAPLVEDCIQDLFSDLWEKRMQMNAVDSVKSYLLVSVRRRIIRKLSSTRQNTLPIRLELIACSQDFTPSMLDTISEEQQAQLAYAFSKLSDKQKEVIYLRFYNQLSYEEIAEVMSVQVKAIYKLMARAMQVLRMHIGNPALTSFLFAFLAT